MVSFFTAVIEQGNYYFEFAEISGDYYYLVKPLTGNHSPQLLRINDDGEWHFTNQDHNNDLLILEQKFSETINSYLNSEISEYSQ